MYTFIIFLGLFLMVNSEEKAINGELLMCQCESITSPTDESPLQKRELYTFLISSNNVGDCCDNPALTEYAGYYEVWYSDSWDHPGVLHKSDEATIKMDAKMAQEFGCHLENRQIMVTEINKFKNSPDMLELYPELVE